jgi:hypothetical protein
MTRRGTATIRALFASRPLRLTLIAPIAGLALLASQGSLGLSSVAVAFSGCVSTPFGTAVLYNPSFTVSGIVDATGCGRGIVFDGDHTGKISGATIFGASFEGSNGDGDGLYLDDSGTVTVLNSTIRDNHDAGVDMFDASNLVMNDSTVDHNGGRGLDISEGSTATIDETSITNTTNTGEDGDGDGVHLDGTGLVTITSSNISNNYDGGIDDHFGSSLFMASDTVKGNRGSGVDIADDSTATINTSLITGTLDSSSGGEGDGDGVYAHGSGNVTIAGSQMNGNTDDGVDFRDSVATFVLRSDVMKSNDDNGLYLDDVNVTSTASLFVYNDTGIYLNSAAATLTDPVVEANSGTGVHVFGALTMTHGFVLANDIGVENDGATTAYRSVLCKNKTTDVDNDGAFSASGSVVCHDGDVG